MRTACIDELETEIVARRQALTADRGLLVGISGIDASGKGFIAAKLANRLHACSWNVAVISADDWLNLPHICVNQNNYTEHFYQHAMRFDEMFEKLIIPLAQRRALSVVADCADAQATTYRRQRYDFCNVDIVLVEGIFFFKPEYRDHFDLKIWIECSFDTALQRAMARGQEGLPPAETRHAFETIYFPAQRVHLARDNPRDFADIIFANDRR